MPPRRSPAELAAAHRLRQQRLAVLARTQLRRLWRHVDPARAAGSWSMVAGRAAALVRAAQLEAARGADAYVAAALVAAGADPDPVGAVVAAAFAGTAADGRDLAGLLGYPAFEVSAFLDRGMAANSALTIGGRHLDRIVMTEVADAARTATGAAVVSDRAARGFVRHLTLPSCGRCVVLAGRWYAVNSGFQRHPQCDCVHLPAPEVIEPQSPRALFEQMSAEEQARAFTVAGAQAIRDGADIGQVVNARRGMYVAGVAGRHVRATREGVTTRGLFGGYEIGPTGSLRRRSDAELAKRGRRYRETRALRLMPEQIYAEARRLGWSRDEVIRQLRRFGYIA